MQAHILRPVAYAEGQGKANGQLDGSDDEEGVAPLKSGDEPGQDDGHDTAGAGAHGQEGKSAPAPTAEPVSDGHYTHGAGSGAHPDGDDHNRPVERPQGLNLAEQDKAQGYGGHPEDHQPPRAHPVHQEADDGGGDAPDLGAEGKGEGDGGAAPTELVHDRVEERAEAIEEGAAGQKDDGG